MNYFTIISKDKFGELYLDEVISTYDITDFIKIGDKISIDKKTKINDKFGISRIITKIQKVN